MTRRLKYILTLLQAIICLFILLLASYAWFTENRVDNANGELMQMDGQAMAINSYNVYRYNSEGDYFEEITVDDPDAPHPVYAMAAYDSIFTERNMHMPLLFSVKIEGFSASTTQLTMTVNCTCEETHGDNGKYTSNLIYLNAASEGTINPDLDATLAEGSHEQCKDVYEKVVDGYFLDTTKCPVSTRKAFLTASKSGDEWTFGTKLTEQTLTIDLTAEECANRSAVVYFILDYDTNLVAAQQIQAFGDIDLQKGNEITYTNDIAKISFEAAS